MLAIASLIHLILRDEFECCGVDAIPQPRRLGSVLENVTEMGVSALAPDLDPVHTMAHITELLDLAFLDGLGEAGPTATRIKLVI